VHALVDFPLYVPFPVMVFGGWLGVLAAHAGDAPWAAMLSAGVRERLRPLQDAATRQRITAPIAGEVVGLNSQIFSNSGGYQGLSFAIPIDAALRIAQQVLDRGDVRHAKLGVTVQELNQTLAESFKLETPAGALVSSVEKGSAAERAGLESGDVVLSVNGRLIDDPGDLTAAIGLAQPGDRINLLVWHDGARRSLQAALDEASADTNQSAASGTSPAHARLGLVLRSLPPAETRESTMGAGLLVEAVSGPAERAGLRRGDVLLAINSSPVASDAQVRAAVSEAGRSVALLVQRGEQKRYVPLKLE